MAKSLAIQILDNLIGAADALLEAAPILSEYNIHYYNKWGQWPPKITRRRLQQEANRLQKRGLVQIRKTGPKIQIKITKTGLAFLKSKKLKNMRLEKTDHWDGKWRLVIFDIPESCRGLRFQFRSKLKDWGFVQVQKSAWVSPYKCRDAIAAICRYYKIEKFVTIFEGKYLGNDKILRKIFKLTQ